MKLTCPACRSPELKTCEPTPQAGKCPSWRCLKCNVQFIVTNPSYLTNMKIKAFRLEDTGTALLLANARPKQGVTVTKVWVPRSVITHLRIWPLRPAQEKDLPNMVHATIEGWFRSKHPQLEKFDEI